MGKAEKMDRKFMDFTGKVCVVTGAGSPTGIGFATAKRLGELGGTIAVVATSQRIFQRVVELEEKGIKAKGYLGDLMDRRWTASMIKQIALDLGEPAVLINNAGMVQVGCEEDFSEVMEMSYESWDNAINRNLNLCFNVTKEVLPYMAKNNYGRIVNIASVTGPVVSNPGEAGYSAAKAGVVGFSLALAIEIGKKNITVNNVLPGWIGTASQTDEEAAAGKNTPVGRSGTADEVAAAAVFLASKEASYITGQSLIVDGGNIIQEYKGPQELYY